MARPVQLTLPFPVQDDRKVSGVSEVAMLFVQGIAPEPYSGVKIKSILKNDKDGIEAGLPQYRKAYHDKSNWGSPLALWEPLVAKFLTDSAKFNPNQPLIVVNADRHAITPAYLKFDKVKSTRRVIIDYAFNVYPRDPAGPVDNTRVALAVWNHAEFKIHKYEKRHVYDMEKSHIIIGSPMYGVAPYVVKPADVADLISVRGMVVPFVQFGSFRLNMSAWWEGLLTDMDLWIRKNLLLNKNMDMTDPSPSPAAVAIGGHHLSGLKALGTGDRWGNKDSEVAVLGTGLLTSDNRKMFVDRLLDKYVGEDVKKTPSLYSTFITLLEPILGDLQKLRAQATPRLTYITLISRVYAHYNDATILRYVITDEEKLEKVCARLATKLDLTNLFGSKLFNAFPRDKQYRLIAEILGYEDTHNEYTVGDLCVMLVKVDGVEDADLEGVKWDPSRIKNITSFHDEAVKLFNAIRYKPVKYSEKIIGWLNPEKLDIPNTTYRVVVPEDTNVVRGWGQTQRHCIGTYAEGMVTGQSILLGVWDESKADWFGHLQISAIGPNASDTYRYNRPGNEKGNWQINPRQFYGRGNCALPNDQKQLVINHLTTLASEHKAKIEAEAAAKAQEKAVVNG